MSPAVELTRHESLFRSQKYQIVMGKISRHTENGFSGNQPRRTTKSTKEDTGSTYGRTARYFWGISTISPIFLLHHSGREIKVYQTTTTCSRKKYLVGWCHEQPYTHRLHAEHAYGHAWYQRTFPDKTTLRVRHTDWFKAFFLKRYPPWDTDRRRVTGWKW